MNEQQTKERFERAMGVARQLFPSSEPPTMDLPSEFIQSSLGHLFGEVWTRPGLSVKLRSLVTITTVLALARNAETHMHLQGALGVGWTPEEIREIITHVGYYAGFPSAVEGHRILNDILAERNQK